MKRWSGTTVLRGSGGWHFQPKISLFEPGSRFAWTEKEKADYQYERFRWWNLRHLRQFFGGQKQR